MSRRSSARASGSLVEFDALSARWRIAIRGSIWHITANKGDVRVVEGPVPPLWGLPNLGGLDCHDYVQRIGAPAR